MSCLPPNVFLVVFPLRLEIDGSRLSTTTITANALTVPYAKRTSKAKVFSWKQANHFAKVTPEWEFRIKIKNVHTTKKSNCGHFQPHLHHYFSKGWIPRKENKSVKKYRKSEDVMKSFFILTTKKYLLTNFTLQQFYYYAYIWIFVKIKKVSSEIFIDF